MDVAGNEESPCYMHHRKNITFNKSLQRGVLKKEVSIKSGGGKREI